ncbi:DUF934 domain-containing protein [Aminobacter sp. AP02]|uniref:DUF934 domain-containing protein n=1 Tax=Aminobacter sp. AP02 TaxID=2135737 RepID=UPI001304C5AE|nr:DUF934 domain-containing protein [Aminobacter sp. AP02]
MALIDSNANVIEDTWLYPDTSHVPAGAVNFVIPFDVFTGVAAGCAVERPVGVLVTPQIASGQLAPYLDKIDLVVVQFAEPREIQGLSTAQALRQHHDFKGDIRALGNLLPDQRELLVKCGFSSIVTTENHPPDQWKAAMPGAALNGRPPRFEERDSKSAAR